MGVKIEESLPNTFAIHVKSITELEKVLSKDNKYCCCHTYEGKMVI